MSIDQDVESRPSSIQHVLTAEPYTPFAKVLSLEVTQNQMPKSNKLILLSQLRIKASLAQLAERQSHNLKVDSSNLPWSILFLKKKRMLLDVISTLRR